MTLTMAQKEARRGRIGSTDVPALVAYYRPELAHLAKKKNATDVWLRLVHDVEQPQRSVMDRGVRVEPILKELYRKYVGPVPDAPETMRHPRHEWAVGSPDGLTATTLAEYKTCSNWIRDRWGTPGTDNVPDDYNVQVQWLMEVAGRGVAHVIVAFGNDFTDENGNPDFNITETAAYVVNRDAVLAASLFELAENFWTVHVVPRVPPPGLLPVHNRRIFKRLTNGRSEAAEWHPEAE